MQITAAERLSTPQLLKERVEASLDVVGTALDAANEAVRAAVPRVFAASPFVAQLCTQDPERFAGWLRGELFTQAATKEMLTTRLAAQPSDPMRALRELRNERMARIAFRAIAGWAELDETLSELSDLADACCAAALRWAEDGLRERLGAPLDATGAKSRPMLLGMGKLGGRELNFSSDIDLIFGYTAPGATSGPRVLDNEEYFARLSQEFTRLVAERTPDGFVFRVDWLLRPFGASGPPAMALETMADYYEVHGREWERYALIKARPVAGQLDAGHTLLKDLQPFVYRRYLDYNAVGALRDLKRRIAEDVERTGKGEDIKLGAGGIRELEFIVQAFQLVRGGQEPQLRDTRLRPVLRYLGEAGHLPAQTAQALDEAYVFLRRLENAIQMYQDQQTHALPQSSEGRAALCVALDFPDWEALHARLKSVRAAVQAEFERVFEQPRAPAKGSAEQISVDAIWNGTLDPQAAEARLRALGFGDRAGELAQAIGTLRQSFIVKTLPDATVARLTALLPALLAQSRRQPDPGTTALRLLKIVTAIAGRGTYLTLLRESETARAHLAELCAASPWITDLIARLPILLDQLLDARTLYAPPDRDGMQAELDELFSNVAPGDTEAAMNALRRFTQEVTLRVAAADRVKALPLVKVSDRLTWLAEVVIARALSLVRQEMREQYGAPLRADGKPAGFAVVAYGKFGGLEMGYGSDLDLVFLHDCDAPEADTLGGKRGITAGVYLARLAQRLVHWLSTQTGAGRAYEVDLELRPSGRSGLTVSSIAGFEDYQRHHAWTWEHQALVRARAVAGEAPLRESFERLRRDVLTALRDADKLRADVLDMRARMRRHNEKRRPGAFDVKQGTGGLMDIEFIAQYLVLRHAHRHPSLVEWPDNWRQVEALQKAGVLDGAQAQTLIATYRAYRAWLHARDLQQQDHLAEDSAFVEEREAVQTLWRGFLGEAPPLPNPSPARGEGL